MTTGNVTKQLAAFSIPTFLANLLQAMYGLADMIIVGQFVGDAGLSAAGLCGEVMVIITAASTGMCTGGTVVLAQYMGLRDDKNQSATVMSLFILMTATALALTLAGLALTPLIVRAIQTPAEAIVQAEKYLRYSCGGIIFIFGYNMVCAVFRGFGNSRIPMYIIGLAAVLNVALDMVLVGALGMDAGGAALATVIAQGVSFLIALWVLFSKFAQDFKLSHEGLRFDREKVMLILKVGIPNMLQVVLVHLSLLFVAAIISSHGVTASAASGIMQKMTSISILVRQSVGAGVSTMTGQNISVGNNARVEKIVKTGVMLSFAASVVLFAVNMFLPETLAKAFTSEYDVIKETARYLRIGSVSYLFMAPMTIYNSLAIGAGHSRRSMFNSTLDAVVCRIPLTLVLGHFFGLTGIYIATAASPLAATISGRIYFVRKKWQNVRLIES